MDVKDAVEQAYKNGYEDGKKETTRAFADKLLERYFALSSIGNCKLEFTALQEIAKQFGVDLGEGK